MYIQYSIEIATKIFNKNISKNSVCFMAVLCCNLSGFYLNFWRIEYKIVG